MILLQIVVGVLNARGRAGAKSPEPVRIETSDKAEDIPVTDEEVRLLASQIPEVVKEIVRQEQDKE